MRQAQGQIQNNRIAVVGQPSVEIGIHYHQHWPMTGTVPRVSIIITKYPRAGFKRGKPLVGLERYSVRTHVGNVGGNEDIGIQVK
jgi:hypothetical protein